MFLSINGFVAYYWNRFEYELRQIHYNETKLTQSHFEAGRQE